MAVYRVLLAKPGLDGHDAGIKLVARALRESGIEVVYLGMRQSAEQIVSTAIQEDVDIIGVSILSGIHLSFARRLINKLKQENAEDISVIIGGVIPDEDVSHLKELGIREVFPVGSSFDRIVGWVQAHSRGGKKHG